MNYNSIYYLCQEKSFPLVMNKLIMYPTISNSATKHQIFYILFEL